MSACIFFAADFNLPEKERPDGSILEIDFERGIELWHVWLTGFCEYDERPYRKTMTVPICDLTIDDIKTVCEFDVWPSDKARPTDVCLVITHER